MSKEIKILVGVTKENELYFLEISNEKYFSMSGFTIEPLELEEAKKQSYESIKNLVEEETRDISGLYLRNIDEIVEEVIKSDGNLSGLDTSLFSEEIEANGDEYVFLSQSCGQHELKAEEIKTFFIDEFLFINLLIMWKAYHLKQVDFNSTVEDILKWAKEISQKQDINGTIKNYLEENK